MVFVRPGDGLAQPIFERRAAKVACKFCELVEFWAADRHCIPIASWFELDAGAIARKAVDHVGEFLDGDIVRAAEVDGLADGFIILGETAHDVDDVTDKRERAAFITRTCNRKRFALHGEADEVWDHVPVAAREFAWTKRVEQTDDRDRKAAMCVKPSVLFTDAF